MAQPARDLPLNPSKSVDMYSDTVFVLTLEGRGRYQVQFCIPGDQSEGCRVSGARPVTPEGPQERSHSRSEGGCSPAAVFYCAFFTRGCDVWGSPFCRLRSRSHGVTSLGQRRSAREGFFSSFFAVNSKHDDTICHRPSYFLYFLNTFHSCHYLSCHTW